MSRDSNHGEEAREIPHRIIHLQDRLILVIYHKGKSFACTYSPDTTAEEITASEIEQVWQRRKKYLRPFDESTCTFLR